MKSSALVFSSFLILLGCTYAPKDKFINPIKQPSATIKVSVNIQDPNFTDPYPLIYETTFNFKIDSTTKPIIETQVLLDGNPINNITVNGMNLSFTLNPCQLSNGNHLIKISIKIDTQSGSLADKLGAEYYLIEKDFTVIVDNALPTSNNQSLSFTMENGYLKIGWEKPSKSNFYYYIYHSYMSYSQIGDTIITDPTISSFIDSGYVGGALFYEVRAVGGCSSTFSTIAAQDYNLTPTNFTFTNNNNFVEVLSWNQLTTINPSNLTIELQTFQTKTDTIINISQGQNYVTSDAVPIGVDMDVATITLKRKNSKYHKYYTQINFSPHYNFVGFDLIKSTVQPNKLFVSRGTDIVRMSLPNLTKEDSTSKYYSGFSISQLAIDDNGQIGVILQYGGSNMWKFNPSDFSVISNIQFNSTNFISTVNNISSPLTKNELMGINYVQDYTYTDPANTPAVKPNIAGIMDLSSSNIVWSDTSNNDTPIISSDGNYFVVSNSLKSENTVYKNDNGAWNFLGIVPIGTKYFRNNATTELLIMNSNNISVFDLSQPVDVNNNFTVVRSFSIDQNQIVGNVGYDDASQGIYIEYFSSASYPKLSTIKVYDVQSFAYKGSGTAYIDMTNSNLNHVYSDGYHFLSGYAQKIK